MNKRFFPLMGLGLAALTLSPGVAQEPAAIAQAEPIWYNCLTREVFTPEKQAWCDRWQVLQNGEYIVPTSLDPDAEYTTVILENGRYEQAQGAFFVELVNQEGWNAFGDLDGDGQDDAAVIFGVALDPNGQNLATYLTAVLDVDGEAQALEPVRLGERIALNGPIAIENNWIINLNNWINVPLLTMTEVIDRAYAINGTALSELVSLPEPMSAGTRLPEGTLLFSQTPDYAVRVFSQAGQLRLNLYNKATGLSELSAVPVVVEPNQGGMVYHHIGEPAVRIEVTNTGTQTIQVKDQMLQGYGQITGTITYRPRIALPPNAIVEVTLVDVSRADAPAITMAAQKIVTAGRQVPIPFALVYDPAQIDSRMTYAVQARITVDGDLRFINTTRTAVITQDNPTEVEITVDPVSQ